MATRSVLEEHSSSVFADILLGVLLSAFILWGFTKSIDNDKQTEKLEAKTLAARCKLLSHSVLASPTLSTQPLSLYLCKDGDIEYHYVTNQKIK